MAKATCVYADGPFPDQCRHTGEEIPMWAVGPQDDYGDDVGGVIQCYTREEATRVGQDMARRLRVPFVNEAGPA